VSATAAAAALALLLPSASAARAADGAAHPAESRAAKVVDSFYNLEFDAARNAAKSLQTDYPEHPAGYFYDSVAIYQRFILEADRREELLAAFEAATERTLEKSESYLPTGPATGHYYLGAAHGFRARARISLGKRFAAVRSARRGAKHMREAVELDPSFTDAYLGLGMYNYYLSRVPKAVKPLAALAIGMWGDRDEGLRQLNRVAAEGRAARMEARSALAGIFASPKEKRYAEALPLLEELERRYPRNPIYRLRKVLVLERLGRWQEAAAAADPAGSWLGAVPENLRPPVEAVGRYRRAECFLMLGRYDEAVKELDAMRGLPAPGGLEEWIPRRREEAAARRVPPADELWRFRWPLTGAPE
jgi:tetratricopeptide (TPR) repeat protein